MSRSAAAALVGRALRSAWIESGWILRQLPKDQHNRYQQTRRRSPLVVSRATRCNSTNRRIRSVEGGGWILMQLVRAGQGVSAPGLADKGHRHGLRPNLL